MTERHLYEVRSTSSGNMIKGIDLIKDRKLYVVYRVSPQTGEKFKLNAIFKGREIKRLVDLVVDNPEVIERK